MSEGQNIEGGQQGGFMGAWRKSFKRFLRKFPAEPGQARGPEPSAPLTRTDTNTPLQDTRDRNLKRG